MKIPAQTVQNLKPWALSTLSGALLILIFPRFDLEFLAWIALVPLFAAIQDQPLNRAAWLGFWSGMIFYFFGLHWVTNTLINYGNLPLWLSYPVLALLAAYLSFYLALFCYLIKRWSRGNSLFFFVLAPVLWTTLEYLRSTHPDYGFSWLGLGYSQYLNLPVIQIAEITGVYGVSALIVLVNAAIHYVVRIWLFRESGAMRIRVAAITAAVLVGCLGFGVHSLKQHGGKPGNSIHVALVQGNIPQHQKWDAAFRDQVFDQYRKLTLRAAESKPDLIVWPEAATPFYYSLNEPGTRKVNNLARAAGSPLLLGSPYQETRDEQLINYNSAFLVSPAGEIRGRYDKIHLVPFGEFVPFQKILFFVRKLVHTIGNFGKGQEATVFDLNGVRFGVSICYEITFPDLVRRPVKNGAQFLVNITNDAWFGRSAASYQHMAMGSLRAVENRVPIIRAANTGISGVIDPTGRMRQTTPLFEQYLVMTAIAPSSNGPTPYARTGDLFSWLCAAVTGILAFLARRLDRKANH